MHVIHLLGVYRNVRRREYRIEWPFYKLHRFISISDRLLGAQIDVHVLFKYGRVLKTGRFALLTLTNLLLQDLKLYNTYLQIIDHGFINRY